jgi:hypothetical protein
MQIRQRLLIQPSFRSKERLPVQNWLSIKRNEVPPDVIRCNYLPCQENAPRVEQPCYREPIEASRTSNSTSSVQTIFSNFHKMLDATVQYRAMR